MTGDYNVLFIISDQHRRGNAGCYGNSLIKTPNLDRFAEDGIRFNQAYCPSPLCGPSRSAIMTGAHCHTCRGLTHTQPLPIRDMPTMGSIFRDAGYTTGSIGKVHIKGENDKRDLGFDERALRYYTYGLKDYIEAVGRKRVGEYVSHHGNSGPDAPKRDHYNPENRPVNLERKYCFDDLVVDRSIEFMDRNRNNRFCLWAGLEKPHPEWYAPEEFHKLYKPEDMPVPGTIYEPSENVPEIIRRRQKVAERYTEDQIRNIMAAYYANVSYLDDNIGRLLKALESLDLDKRTIVVYTSDHGDMLFEHGMLQKHCFFEGAVTVPFLIRHPQISGGHSNDSLVSLIDILPTMLDLTGVGIPDSVEGESLVPLLESGKGRTDNAVFSEFYKWGYAERMVRKDNWKYIHSEGQPSQLYDLDNDPVEVNNLASDQNHAEVCERLEEAIMDDWEIPPADLIAPPRQDKLNSDVKPT
jgi:choline-sulfatase